MPTQNTDGTRLHDLAGYRLYYGSDDGPMDMRVDIEDPNLTGYLVADLGTGTHLFGVTAYDREGVESPMSILGSKTIL